MCSEATIIKRRRHLHEDTNCHRLDTVIRMYLCSLKDLSSRHGTRFELPDGREIALFVVDGVVYAISNVCPHQHVPLIYEGAIEEGTVTCPMHGRRYRLVDGECLEPSGSASLPTYRSEVRGEEVHLDVPEQGEPPWMRAV